MNAICVFAGSSESANPVYPRAARRLGALIAGRKIQLVYGGGRTGLMGALADGALEAGGTVTGVIVESMNTPALAHPGLSQLEVTSTIHARKARMYELADGFIALPGGFGTFDELFETITWGQIGIHQKPVGLLNIHEYFRHLMAAIKHAEQEGFIFPEHRQLLVCKANPEKLLDAMQNHKHPDEAVRRWMRKD
jgi:uncharacterized protein (TIGR00730 family)